MAALIAGQIGGATPAGAAELGVAEQPGGQQIGAFVGARVRLPLDGAGRNHARVALTAAPTLGTLQSNGWRRLRIGEGFELGGQGNQVQLSYAGRPVSRLVGDGQAPDGTRRNISPIGWVAIGIGALALAFLAFGLCYEAGECAEGE